MIEVRVTRDARRFAPNVEIDTDGGPYPRMTLSVPDPQDTAAAIEGMLRLRR